MKDFYNKQDEENNQQWITNCRETLETDCPILSDLSGDLILNVYEKIFPTCWYS